MKSQLKKSTSHIEKLELMSKFYVTFYFTFYCFLSVILLHVSSVPCIPGVVTISSLLYFIKNFICFMNINEYKMSKDTIAINNSVQSLSYLPSKKE